MRLLADHQGNKAYFLDVSSLLFSLKVLYETLWDDEVIYVHVMLS